jgi:hypothetical protein
MCPATILDNGLVIAEAYAMFHSGGDWDHKPKLKQKYSLDGNAFWTPIAGNPRREQIIYDIWSNIHYGYVARAHGFPRKQVMDFPEWGEAEGKNTPHDRLSIRIGMTLWADHKGNLLPSHVQKRILANMYKYRPMTNSAGKRVVRPGWY